MAFDLSYGTSYSNLLNEAQGLYGDILSGYQNALQAQSGYGQLSNQVLGTIQGVGASQQQALADVYAQQSGQAAQQLVNRGLGNTTVQQSVQRGLTLDYSKAGIALANQLAQLSAGYQSQLGLAGLQAGNQFRQSQLGYQGQWQGDLLRAATQLYGRGTGQGGGGIGGSSPVGSPGGGAFRGSVGPGVPGGAGGGGMTVGTGYDPLINLGGGAPTSYFGQPGGLQLGGGEPGADIYGGGIDQYGNPLAPAGGFAGGSGEAPQLPWSGLGAYQGDTSEMYGTQQFGDENAY